MSEGVIGLMDSAYFVSKNDLLKWLNDILQLEITFIEDLGAGSTYCQLLDAYHRQAVPMGKLNWKAKFQYEFMGNLKLFQQGLERIGCNKKIDLNKLARAKYQDNLEVLQWLKRYLEMTATRIAPYDPVARRNGEQFHSHHAQKSSYVNRPGKSSLNTTLTTAFTSSKKDPENKQQQKMDRIKKALQCSGQDANAKLELISEIVYGPPRKALFTRNFNCGKIEEEVL